MNKINNTYQSLKDLFESLKIPSQELTELMQKIAGISEENLISGEMSLSDEKLALLLDAISKRVKSEPLAHILGEKAFWNDTFQVNSYTLIPRPESERLLEETLKAIEKKYPEKQKALQLLDLGTGTGCLIISLVKELENRGYSVKAVALDLSPQALEMAKRNAKKLLGDHAQIIDFHQASWQDLDKIKPVGEFDVIISNPPYISSKEIFKLEKSVKDYEPLLALDGGPDGLDKYREIIALFKKTKNSLLGIEIGFNQANKVLKLLKGYKTNLFQDFQGLDRVIVAE